MGPCGAGKTHLAVAALARLFCADTRGSSTTTANCSRKFRAATTRKSQSTELGVLEPVLTADVLLLDD